MTEKARRAKKMHSPSNRGQPPASPSPVIKRQSPRLPVIQRSFSQEMCQHNFAELNIRRSRLLSCCEFCEYFREILLHLYKDPLPDRLGRLEARVEQLARESKSRPRRSDTKPPQHLSVIGIGEPGAGMVLDSWMLGQPKIFKVLK